MNKDTFDIVVGLILEERKKQFEKWGDQRHNVSFWLVILGEEFGEMCKAALHTIFGGEESGKFQSECIQMTAVGFQILENIIDGQDIYLPEVDE